MAPGHILPTSLSIGWTKYPDERSRKEGLHRLLNNIPFSVYDFFAYLSAGVVVLAAFLYLGVGGTLPTAWQGTLGFGLGVVVAYSAGHVVAQLSGFLFERKLTIGVIGRSEYFLLRQPRPAGWRAALFPGYIDGLPTPTIESLLARVPKEVAKDATRRAVFLHCWRSVRQSPAIAARLDTFLAQYGYCRNMAMALLVAAVILMAAGVADRFRHVAVPSELWVWLAGALFIAPFMYYRYLKFYRQYTYEVFTNYSDSPP